MERGERERRGQEAKRLSQEPLLIEAFAEIEAEAVEEMLSASSFHRIGDQKRRRAADKIQTIRGLRRHLEYVIASGGQAHKGPKQVP